MHREVAENVRSHPRSPEPDGPSDGHFHSPAVALAVGNRDPIRRLHTFKVSACPQFEAKLRSVPALYEKRELCCEIRKDRFPPRRAAGQGARRGTGLHKPCAGHAVGERPWPIPGSSGGGSAGVGQSASEPESPVQVPAVMPHPLTTRMIRCIRSCPCQAAHQSRWEFPLCPAGWPSPCGRTPAGHPCLRRSETTRPLRCW